MRTVAPADGRTMIDGTLATTTAITTTTSDTLSFGTLNLALSGGATTVTVSGTQSIGNITFGLAQTNAMTLTGGTINFAAAGTIYSLAPSTTQTISSVISGAGTSLTTGGQGTIQLTNANTYTGTTIVTSGGTLIIGNGATGSLNGTTGTAPRSSLAVAP
jgi:fibronectin-binding autotransporter adhesin